MAPNLPFKRPLYPPDAAGYPPSEPGDDVIAVKRAISRAGFWLWQEFDANYSNRFSHGGEPDGPGVTGFQWKTKLSATGYYGKTTHEKLRNYRIPAGLPNAGEWAFDKTAIKLYNGFDDETAAERVAQEIVTWCEWFEAREPNVHYAQTRPIPGLSKQKNPPPQPVTLDCSGSTIYVAWLADVAPPPDPQYGYSGYGFTGSLIKGGTKIPEADAVRKAKDHLVLAFYGPNTSNSSHVVIVLRDGRVFSHGQEAGPLFVDGIHYRSDLLMCRAYPVA